MSRSGSLASDWFYLGRVRPLDEISAALDALTPESVARLRRRSGPRRHDDPDPRAQRRCSSPTRLSGSRAGRAPADRTSTSSDLPDLLSPTAVEVAMRFHHTTLDNGLQVIAELNDQARLGRRRASSSRRGAATSRPSVAGVSHFLEHMIFKGTPRRDALAVNRDFDRVGAKHNAQTSEEDTFYHVTCLPEYLPQAFDVLVRHPPPEPPRGRLRDREEGDHRRDPDVPGQPDVGRLRGRQGGPLRRRTRSGRASSARSSRSRR